MCIVFYILCQVTVTEDTAEYIIKALVNVQHVRLCIARPKCLFMYKGSHPLTKQNKYVSDHSKLSESDKCLYLRSSENTVTGRNKKKLSTFF